MIKQIFYEIKAIEVNTKKLKEFGFLVGGIFVLIGIYWKLLWPLAIIGAVMIVLTLTNPGLLKKPYIYWMSLAVVLGFFVFRILLSLIYFAIITPIGFILRLLGNNPMKSSSNKTSWVKVDKSANNPKGIENPF